LTSFNGLGLHDAIARAIAEEKHTTPTPIQEKAIPVIMSRRDVIGIAQTGTGKTAAFALPILHHLATNPRPHDRKGARVVVLSPTRELASQILASFRAYGRHLPLRMALAIGGVSIGAQVRALANGVDIVVATPGRLLDLIDSNAFRLGGVEICVLDEADRMLDMGFIHDIRKIMAKMPAQRQTLLFSATMPRAIAELAGHLLRDPVNVAVAPVATTAERVEQRLIRVDRGAKIGVLVGVLQQEAIDRALIFAKTKRGADKIVQSLGRSGIFAEAIHGNKSQNQRERVLAAFRRGTVRILVATDIAARGIDVDGVSHVVNFDLPHVAETYVHRIGRTARAGATGVAISLCDQDETGSLRDIERLIRMSIPATDRRLNPVRPGASGDRPARANDRSAPASDRPGAGKRSAGPPRKRRRGGGGKRPDRQHEQHKGPSRGIGSVAFLHRDDAAAGNRTDRAGR